jgi:hypothetical protein
VKTPRKVLIITPRALHRRVIKSNLKALVAFECCFCGDECTMYFQNNDIDENVSVDVVFDVACSCIIEKYKENEIEYLNWDEAARRLRRLTLPSNATFKVICTDDSVTHIHLDSMMELVEIKAT